MFIYLAYMRRFGPFGAFHRRTPILLRLAKGNKKTDSLRVGFFYAYKFLYFELIKEPAREG